MLFGNVVVLQHPITKNFLPLANNLPVTAISSYCHGSETTALVPLLLHTDISQFSIAPLTGNISKSSNEKAQIGVVAEKVQKV